MEIKNKKPNIFSKVILRSLIDLRIGKSESIVY